VLIVAALLLIAPELISSLDRARPARRGRRNPIGASSRGNVAGNLRPNPGNRDNVTRGAAIACRASHLQNGSRK
jgi:hypothetical protein